MTNHPFADIPLGLYHVAGLKHAWCAACAPEGAWPIPSNAKTPEAEAPGAR